MPTFSPVGLIKKKKKSFLCTRVSLFLIIWLGFFGGGGFLHV